MNNEYYIVSLFQVVMSSFIPAREEVYEFLRLLKLSQTQKFRNEGSRFVAVGPPNRREFCVRKDGRKNCPYCGKICNKRRPLKASILNVEENFRVGAENGEVFFVAPPLQTLNNLQTGFPNHRVVCSGSSRTTED